MQSQCSPHGGCGAVDAGPVAPGRRAPSRWARAITAASVVVAAVVLPVSDGIIPVAEAAATSAYTAVGPARLADTRLGEGFRRLDARTIRVQVAGAGGVPSNAVAGAFTVSLTEAQGPGFITMWPSGQPMPLAANITFESGQTLSNGAMTALGAGGSVDIYVSVPAQVVLDVSGAFLPASAARAGRFVPVDPVRVVDTRGGAELRRGGAIDVPVPAGVAAGAQAVVVNLTSTDADPGYLTTFGAGQPQPFTASLTMDAANAVRGSLAIIPIDRGVFKVFSSSGGHVVADLAGYFTGDTAAQSGDGLFVPTTPTRLIDTRTAGPLGPGDVIDVDTSGAVSVGNLTITGSFGAGFVTASASGTPRPFVSSLNATRAGQTVTNLAVSLRSERGMTVFAQNGGHIVYDETGYFTGAQVKAILPPNCGVSSLLVPSCGAWLGTSVATRSGDFDPARGVAEYEAVAGSAPDIIHLYRDGVAQFPNQSEIALTQRAGKPRSILFYNWKPSERITWRQIADGGADDAIASVAAGLKRYPHKLFLAIWHEPENDMRAPGSGMSEADYVAMYRHVVEALRRQGVTNSVFVWNVMGYSGWASSMDALYPGHDVVDWIAYDPYGHAKQREFAGFLNRPVRSWPGFYAWATAKAPGKPIMLGEWAIALNEQPLAPAILDGAAPIIATQFPALKALVYWNSMKPPEYDFRLDQPSALGAAYGAAYARFAASPLFNSTPTALAP